MGNLSIKFEATGEGHVVCKRTREDGSEASEVRYYASKGAHPTYEATAAAEGWGLTDAQETEFVAAMNEEFGVGNWTRR